MNELNGRIEIITTEKFLEKVVTIMHTPKYSLVLDYLLKKITLKELIEGVEDYIPILKQEDQTKKQIYQSGAMGRLCAHEWKDERDLDLPFYEKELEFLIEELSKTEK